MLYKTFDRTLHMTNHVGLWYLDCINSISNLNLKAAGGLIFFTCMTMGERGPMPAGIRQIREARLGVTSMEPPFPNIDLLRAFLHIRCDFIGDIWLFQDRRLGTTPEPGNLENEHSMLTFRDATCNKQRRQRWRRQWIRMTKGF